MKLMKSAASCIHTTKMKEILEVRAMNQLNLFH